MNTQSTSARAGQFSIGQFLDCSVRKYPDLFTKLYFPSLVYKMLTNKIR